MAGASMNDIKARMKSVESTMQITKAMELVATSKLRRAKENAEKSRPYYETLRSAIDTVSHSSMINGSRLFASRPENGKVLFIFIAGDRGLAGGYNSNIFKMTEKLASGKESIFLPIGKKALEYMLHRNRDIFSDALSPAAEVGVGDIMQISAEICNSFFKEEISEVYLIYTKFVSMMTQLPVCEQILPFSTEGKEEKASYDPIIEEEPDEFLMKIVPSYVGGITYCALCEALASECASRRTAMNAANKNASEMIDTLMLKYNRARQAVITQEITEIVSGAEAL
ncbi:MAG: ATP synthase F1 subunit gamma [Clostridia bacterium]|nr:ATP synthase F1 subunit gamma [Clostridia bacterium]